MIDVYRTPDERFDALPGYDYAPHYVEQDGMRMHYVDEGEGAPVLLLHGEPTWAYLYRKVIPQITPIARCVAPGFVITHGRGAERNALSASRRTP